MLWTGSPGSIICSPRSEHRVRRAGRVGLSLAAGTLPTVRGAAPVCPSPAGTIILRRLFMMLVRTLKPLILVLVLGAGLGLYQWFHGQRAAAEPAEGPPPEPRGVEVMARGPVHEAFANPTSEAAPTQSVPK